MQMIAEDIIDAVCQETSVTKSLLLSKDRRQFIVDARQIIIFAFNQLGFTQQFIARQLNYKDHTTVHHHLNKDCAISHKNRLRAARIVKQCDYMASIEIKRQKSNMEEFLELVQKIN